MTRTLPIALSALAACTTIGTNREPPVGDGEQRVVDDTVGASVVVPMDWRMSPDPVLFDTHGFLVHAAGAEHGDAVLRVALAYQATPAQLEDLVATKLAQYADVAPQRIAVELADGRPGVAVTGLPGVHPYTAVYTIDDDRLYEIGVWSADDAPGLDERGRTMLAKIGFRVPETDIARLALPAAADALYGAPPPELATASAEAAARRGALADAAALADPGFAHARTAELVEPPPPGVAAGGCGFIAPASLYWQLQWDETNTFYSGSWYDLRARSGWSAMSGNYGSWWGTNFHVGLCYANHLNQYYANDWPTQYWGNAYAAFSGTVEWAGWGTDGFASLGRYVIVRSGQYRSLTAHLSAIANGIYWGAFVDGYSKVIGWAGDSGEYYANDDWAPHLHARVAWGESLTFNGQPYGGQSVGPSALRCFDCSDHDVAAAGGGGGYYTSYYYGRWMRY